ncbi:MAG: pitrilysin family protein [Gammaproteobacteria bacterium]|nr:pitrilysin family protein [Gammaproteobacteria bacterium]
MKKIILSINTILVSFLLATNSWATVHEKTLENGLKVIVKEDHRAPVATAQVWYKVGSASEYGGITGVSHVLEHMMFKGTPKYPVGQFSEILASIGARDNAFTGRDFTAYYQLFDVSKLETSFDLESDRMAQLNLDEAEFTKELEVVKEERRLRTEDNPNALTYEQFNATAYNSSPYHNPVIGWMNDLDSMQVSDLQNWYQQWYSPNNATLVVVGDVDPQNVFALAEKYYGPVPSREVATLKPRLEPRQVGTRRVEVKAVAKLPYMIIGYKVPTLKTAKDSREAYALNILSGILDGGRSSRLSKHLVREQEIAASAGAGYDLYSARNSMFLFDGTPNAEHTLEELEQAISKEIEKLQTELVSERELKRVKAQVVAGEVYQQDSVQRQAYIIGSLETVELGWKTMNEYADNIQKITAEDVREVAKKYLVDDSKTVAILTPLEPKGFGAK